MRPLALLALLPLLTLPACANDSMAELAIGGLTLVPSADIALESEDLFVSKDEIRVKYRFLNTGTSNEDVLVAFPLPDQVYSEESQAYFQDLRSSLGFKTLVDGKPIDYDIVVQAILDGKDISARIEKTGLPLNSGADVDGYTKLVKALPEAERKALLDETAVINVGTDEEPFYIGRWNLRTTITRHQLFPAGKPVTVEHSYKPVSGGSVGGALAPEQRKEPWFKEHVAKHCIEDSWLAAFDKANAARATADNPAPYSEWWVSYILQSGANWKGPIKDFRLVVDKGKPDNLVSFCADGVKKISPTQFEVRKTNFEPSQDLDVLIVEWYDPNAAQ